MTQTVVPPALQPKVQARGAFASGPHSPGLSMVPTRRKTKKKKKHHVPSYPQSR